MRRSTSCTRLALRRRRRARRGVGRHRGCGRRYRASRVASASAWRRASATAVASVAVVDGVAVAAWSASSCRRVRRRRRRAAVRAARPAARPPSRLGQDAGHDAVVGHDRLRALARRLHAPDGAARVACRAARSGSASRPRAARPCSAPPRPRRPSRPRCISAIAACSVAFWRSSVSCVCTARLMPVFRRSSETCMATIPPSIRPISRMHARPRRRRSTTRWSGIRLSFSKAPVRPRGIGRRPAPGRRDGPETRRGIGGCGAGAAYCACVLGHD